MPGITYTHGSCVVPRVPISILTRRVETRRRTVDLLAVHPQGSCWRDGHVLLVEVVSRMAASCAVDVTKVVEELRGSYRVLELEFAVFEILVAFEEVDLGTGLIEE